MKRYLKLRYALWLLLLPLVWLIFRLAPVEEIVGTLRGLSAAQLVALILLNGVIFLFFSSRWWLLLNAQKQRIPYLSLVGYRLAGFAISYFTPGTQFGGEPLQIYLLGKQQGVPGSTALASVTLDKVLEILANFTFLALGMTVILSSSSFGGFAGPSAALGVGLLLCLPLAYLGLLAAKRYPFTWLARWLSVRLENQLAARPKISRVPDLIASTEEEISLLFRQQPVAMLVAILASGLVWALMVFEYWLMAYFLGAQLTPVQTITALTATRLAFLTPIPAGLGALEAGQAFVMDSFGFSAAHGISLSLLMRGRDIAIGLAGLWWGAVLSSRLAGKAAVSAPAGN